MDEGSIETVWQNSMRLGTMIILKVKSMHILQFLKSDYSAPPGGRLNFSKNSEFDSSDLDMCGQRFHRNCLAEFNETRYNDSTEGVVNARSSILKIEAHA